MLYAAFRDKKSKRNYQKIVEREESYSYYDDDDDDEFSVNKQIKDYHDLPASDNDSESTPLLNHKQTTSSLRTMTTRNIIPDDWSYADWYQMGLIGLNKSVILSILFLSINFGISFSFTILSISNIVKQYKFTGTYAQQYNDVLFYLSIS